MVLIWLLPRLVTLLTDWNYHILTEYIQPFIPNWRSIFHLWFKFRHLYLLLILNFKFLPKSSSVGFVMWAPRLFLGFLLNDLSLLLLMPLGKMKIHWSKRFLVLWLGDKPLLKNRGWELLHLRCEERQHWRRGSSNWRGRAGPPGEGGGLLGLLTRIGPNRPCNVHV